MHIRPAEIKDLTAILDLMNEAILNSTSIYDYKVRSMEFVQDWLAKKKADNMPVLAYEKDNQMVGYGSYGIFRPWAAYQFSVEHSVYVHKNFQGQGIGKQLLSALIEKAKHDGYHTMIAGIDAANETSYAFHAKAGFVEAGRMKEIGFKFGQWLDLIFMQLLLA